MSLEDCDQFVSSNETLENWAEPWDAAPASLVTIPVVARDAKPDVRNDKLEVPSSSSSLKKKGDLKMLRIIFHKIYNSTCENNVSNITNLCNSDVPTLLSLLCLNWSYNDLKAVSLAVADSAGIVSTMALNDNKAGMEGLDKERINQIIFEASKGIVN